MEILFKKKKKQLFLRGKTGMKEEHKKDTKDENSNEDEISKA